MREKPVPTRVERAVGEQSKMDVIKKEASFEKESLSSEEDAEELPSMVTVMPINTQTIVPSKHNHTFSLPSSESRSSLDIPGEFEFLNSDSVSESQKQAVKFGVRVFRDWLYKQGMNFQSLEEMSREEIAKALEQFYLTARRPNGTQYKKNTLKSIKHSLDHYLRSSPLKKDFSISSDFDFRKVNKTLDNLPEDADPNRFPQFTKETILKLYEKGQLGLTTTDDPTIIIQTVWFYIVAYFFANIDKRMLRELKNSNLVLERDKESREYYWLDYRPPERIRGDVIKSRIYARPSSLCCPVAIIKKYMDHRNPRNDVLFQHPKMINHVVWYSPLPLGKNKHTDLMKSMCLNAGVDPPLTGRCIKSYVQQLLEDCDENVNEMFRVEGPPPRYLGDAITPMVPPFIFGVPRLSSSIPSLGCIQSREIESNSREKSSLDGSNDNNNNDSPTTMSTDVTNTSRIQGCNITSRAGDLQFHGDKYPASIQASTNLYGLTTYTTCTANSTSIGNISNNFVLPYLANFPTITDFSKPRDLYNSSLFGSPLFPNTFTLNNQGGATNCLKPPSSNHGNSSACNDTLTAKTADSKDSRGIDEITRKETVEMSTQTEEEDDEWLQTVYHKADLKTRNRMRYQARKSLLCFLEELNEISDGHGMELLEDIVREDRNMLKIFTIKPSTLK